MRARLKAILERGAVVAVLPRIRRRRRQPHRLILAYHNVVPDGEVQGGDCSLHLSRHDFAKQLDILSEQAEIVPLAEMLDESSVGTGPRVAITFDDAYSGAVTAGIAELRSRRLPATIFVSPGCLGGQTFWWDLLAGQNGLEQTVRQTALQSYAGDAPRVLSWARSAVLKERAIQKSAVSATMSQLEAAMTYPALSLGSHTWTHPNLTRIGSSELLIELTRPLTWLRSHFEDRVHPWLAYPYGLVDARVQKAAAAAHYSAGFRVTGGWLPPGEVDQFSLPRLNVPAGISVDGFRLRLANLFCE